jgi:hypothetical protein
VSDGDKTPNEPLGCLAIFARVAIAGVIFAFLVLGACFLGFR